MPRDAEPTLPIEPGGRGDAGGAGDSTLLEEGMGVASKTVDERYAAALDYLYGRINYEKIGHAPYNAGNYRLDRMRQLLALLGNPHEAYNIVHVAGTKGKGTTSTLIADCLQACGRQVGLYTSPHLLRLEERIQFQGASCTSAELVELTAAIRAAAEELEKRGSGRSTFFEMTTAMGLLHFARCGANCVVLEVGLGGRLDSTNVCAPVVSVITSISLDHQAQLGETLALIAREKAGIIKPNTPLVCTTIDAEPQAVITEVAREQGAPVKLINRDFSSSWRPLRTNSGADLEAVRAEITYTPLVQADTSCFGHSTWQTRLLGRHQSLNVSAALVTLEVLSELGWRLPVPRIREAIARSHAPARLQIVACDPLCIVDSAHNPASMEAGLKSLNDHFSGVERTIIFASSRDKDFRGMLAQLLVAGDLVVLTAYQENPRAVPVAELAIEASRIAGATACSARVATAETPSDAWKLAVAQSSAGALIYTTGSFFLAAELLPAIRSSQSCPNKT